MINSITFKNNYINTATPFKDIKNTSTTPLTDEFASSLEKELSKNKKNKSLLFWSPTAGFAGMGVLTAGCIGILYKVEKCAKRGLDEVKKKKLINKSILSLGALFLAYYGVVLGIQKLLRLNTDKRYEEIKKEFNRLNTDTNAYIANEPMVSNFIDAMYEFDNGKISINRNLVDDPLNRRKITRRLKHELTHAKQVELIACSKDGLKNFNNIYAEHMTRSIREKDKRWKTFFTDMAEELRNDKTDKYAKVELRGADMSIKDYIIAADAVNRKDESAIPMLINAEHYQKVIDKRGKLSEEEEKKAQEYLKAYKTYNLKPSLGIFNRYNKDYYDNILEKEARAAEKRKD